MPISPARSAAFDILLRVETTDAYASELLHSSRAAKLSPSDHGLATEIVMGVLRWRSVLDERIAAYVDKSLAKLDAEVFIALRIGAYQLLFLDRIPAHAAINESVELVKKARKRSAAGMVNAVLRRVKRPAAAKPAEDSGAPSARPEAVPSRQLRHMSSLDSVARDDSALVSHPDWLVRKWAQNLGADAARVVCEYDQQPPKTAIRAGWAQVEELARDGIQLDPGKLLKAAFVVIAGDLTGTQAFRERRLVIQDEGSQLVALLLGHGQRILDSCAAPGGKTRILAEQNPDSTVIAADLHPHRAALTRRLVALPNVHVVAADIRTMPFATAFDRVLVDAPCTGTGTLARNPEIKWRLQPDGISRMQAYQIEILLAAMKQVAPGGQLLYSTCSLEPEENEGVIEQVLRVNHSFHLLHIRDRLSGLRKEGALVCDPDSVIRGQYLRTIPGMHACDGFFAALLQREM